ncbi:MAG: hypothetical protein OEV63_14545, partial [Gammaproteobacteria bacterium]|nr:hypothetical protein [Gammaproteobacteria bacterium]
MSSMIQNKASRYRRSLNLYALLIVIAVIATIETGRRTGTMVPAPFLLIFGSVALVAGLTGLRTGLAAASIAAMFVVYSALKDFGPATLTGHAFNVLAGSSIAFFTAYLLGSSRDKRIKLTEELLASQAALLDARNELEVIVERRT